MILAPFLIYSLVGGVCVYLLQRFPFRKVWMVGKLFQENGFLYDLFGCDLCLGVWVYAGLAAVMSVNLLNVYIPVLSEMITGGLTSFLVHIIKIGWIEKFGTLEL